MKIDSIKTGIVLDHITAGKSLEVYKALGLDKLDCSVAIIKNVKSNKMGKKDILKIDEESISLSDEKDLYFNFNFCKLKAKDFDADGIKEILVLFYGGASGTFQDFCMVKYDGVKWMSVPCDWNPDDDADNIKLGKGQQLRYRYFKAGKNNIDISYDVYEDGKEKAVKKVHVKIYFNKKKTKLCVQFQN